MNYDDGICVHGYNPSYRDCCMNETWVIFLWVFFSTCFCFIIVAAMVR